MITEYVMFDVPRSMTREQVVEGMRAVAPHWRANPDLIRKTFLWDAENSRSGAFYLWHRKEDALRAHDDTWRKRVKDTFGSVPVIQYFETPMVVDNALGRVVEEAA